VSIDFTRELLAGSLPPRALALVAEWAVLQRDDLLARERTCREEPRQPIEPLPTMGWV
jgi:hypothetical protein